MRGSRTEYVIQNRVQDYWLDYVGGPIGGTYQYVDRAINALARLKKEWQNIDFRLVKRLHTYVDEIVTPNTEK